VLAACLAAAALPAAALQLVYGGTGSVLPGGLPDPDGNLPLRVPPRLTDYDFGFARPWRLESHFVSNLVTGEGAGEFRFLSPFGALGGVLTARAAAVGEFGGFELSYTVESGTGLWAGVIGSGSSLVTLLGSPTSFPTPFTEEGVLQLDLSPVGPVPEPTTALLMLAGLAAVARRSLVERRSLAPQT
jgi:hypothetical protein